MAQEQEETQIERALGELGINIIPANSPQAKGRIEVTFRLFQDRLIKEMRLAGVKDYDEANRFLLERFLPWYNAKYTHQADSAYASIPKDKNLDFIFCKKYERAVGLDNTVQLYGQVIQIPPSKVKRTFAKSKVDVCLFEDNRIFVLYKGIVVAESKLSKSNKIFKEEKKIEALLNNREYVFLLQERPPEKVKSRLQRATYIPPADHPWRSLRLKNSKFVKKLNVTFQRSKNVTS